MAKIVVIGGGPAGMMAAGTAASYGAEVTLMEKKDRVGRKLSITGKGRCNLTSAEDNMERFIAAYPGNGRFLYSALSEFSNHDLLDFFSQRGLETKIERGQRVFPLNDNAQEVVAILHRYLQETGVKVKTLLSVKGIEISSNRVIGVKTPQGADRCDAVVVATGGMSYPGTGSTGDGYVWAEATGHRIIPLRPGLVPLIAKEDWVRELQGLTLKNVRAAAFYPSGKKLNEEFGEMLFTHFGVSGPIILTMSRAIGEYIDMNKTAIKLSIDLKPALNEEKMDQRLQRDLTKYSRRQFKNSLDDLLPGKLIPVIIKLSEINPDKECHQITRRERRNLLALIKSLSLTITGTRPLAEAIVTAGGVDVKQINPKTMESRILNGLYFAGEILDIDGYTGGFNLQAAFSTGYAAGKYAAQAMR